MDFSKFVNWRSNNTHKTISEFDLGENKCNAFFSLDSRRWLSTYQVIDTPLELRDRKSVV